MLLADESAQHCAGTVTCPNWKSGKEIKETHQKNPQKIWKEQVRTGSDMN